MTAEQIQALKPGDAIKLPSGDTVIYRGQVDAYNVHIEVAKGSDAYMLQPIRILWDSEPT